MSKLAPTTSRGETGKSGGSVDRKIALKRLRNGTHKIDYESVKQQIIKCGDLGKVTDQSIADKFGVSRALVGKVRNRLRIPAFVPEKSRTYNITPTYRKALDSGLLGKFRDRDVARAIGTTEKMIVMFRQHEGLPVSQIPLPSWRKKYMEEKWGCIKERQGLSRSQWKRYVQSL